MYLKLKTWYLELTLRDNIKERRNVVRINQNTLHVYHSVPILM